MLYKVEIIINNAYSLALPVNGINLKLFKNEFNLLTTDVATARPLSFVQNFEVPYFVNKTIFAKMQKSGNNFATIKYNDTEIISGPIFDFSANKENDTILISVASSFKTAVDFMGNNILYLDKIRLFEENHIITEFADATCTGLMKYGVYNPMDTETGSILKTTENINDYCRPSLSVFGLIGKSLIENGWVVDVSEIDAGAKDIVLLPSNDYFVSSFGFKGNYKHTIISATPLLNIDTLAYNINNGCEVLSSGAQPRYPARNMAFRIRFDFNTKENFIIFVKEGDNELYYTETNGAENILFTTDFIQTKNGIDPLQVYVKAINGFPTDVDFSFTCENLFSCNETNDDNFLSPLGFMYIVPANYPNLTILDVFRQWLMLYQMALEVNDSTKEIKFYHIKKALNQWVTRVDVNKALLWDGYESITDYGGLSKINTVKFSGGEKKQAHFNTNIASLPASGNYFTSIFSETSENREWAAAVLPTLKYTTKTIDNISSEYLAYNANGYYLGTYHGGAIHTLNINDLFIRYWRDVCNYISTNNGTPTAYKLKLRVFYGDFIKNYKQSNLFYYKTNALLMSGEYDIIKQIFTGVFVSLE